MSARPLHPVAALGRHAVLLLTSAFVLAPFLWMISLSMKPPGEIFLPQISFLPQHFYAIENYWKALTASPMPRFLLNGFIVCFVTLAIQVAIAAPCAYALAKLRFRGRDTLFAMVLIGLLIPAQVLAIPHFIMAYETGILDSYAALIMPGILSTFAIFLFRQFFRSIPDDLVHAARLDGLSEFSIIWRIMVPLATPAIIAFGILSVVGRWNDLFWPGIAVRSEHLLPPPVGIVVFQNEEAGSDYGPLMAASVIVVAPMVLAFLAAQRWFIEGMASGAVK